MSRLPRLGETGDAFERELLASARDDAMSPQARRALVTSLASSAVAGGALASGAAERTARTERAARAGKGLTLSTKWLVLGGVAGVLALAGFASVLPPAGGKSTARPDARPAPGAASVSPEPRAPVLQEPATERLTDVPEAQPAIAPSPAPRAFASSHAPRAGSLSTPRAPAGGDASPSLSAELRLVERAQAAQTARRPGDALAALDEHDALFPSGALADEAAVLRIEASAQMGDRGAASRLAAAFLAAHPRSPYAARVERVERAAGALEPTAGPSTAEHAP